MEVGGGVGGGCWERVLGEGAGRGCWERVEGGEWRVVVVHVTVG